MPNWKKVITSGSNAALNNITASRLTLESSGSTIFDVVGSQGQLFSITDSLSGSLFAVSDITGLPILEVLSDDTVKIGSFNNEAIIVSGSNATITGSFTGSFTGDGSNLTNLPSSDPFPYTGDVIITGSNSNADSSSLEIVNSNEYPLLSLKNDGTLSLGHTTANTTTGNLRLINRQGDSWMGGQNTWGNISAGIMIQSEPTNTLYYRNLLFYVKSTQSAIAGVEKMRLNYDGNLGIGTTSPQERLHVAGNTVITGSNSLTGNYALKVTNTSGNNTFVIGNDGNIGVNTTPSTAYTFYIDDGAATSNTLFVNSYNRIGWNGGARQWIEGWSSRIAFKGGSEGEFARFSGAGGRNRLNVARAIHLSSAGGDTGDTRFTRLDTGTVAIGNSADDASGTLYVGNLGVGNVTGSLTHALEVTGNVSASTYYGDGSNLTGISSDPFPYTGSAIISGSLDVTGSIQSTDNITIKSNTNSSKIILDNTANAGLNEIFEIEASTTNGYGEDNIRIGPAGYDGFRVYGNSNNKVSIGINETWSNNTENTLRIKSIDGSQIGVIKLSNGLDTSGALTGLAFGGLMKSAIYHIQTQNGGYGAGDLAFAVEGTTTGTKVSTSAEKMRITKGGNIGIGLTNPQTNLHVSSSVSASTYYGDGSNLTGISSDPFPYTGSAEISGSLTINGGFNVITPTKTRNSVSVTNSEIKFLLADNGNDNQAVTITRDGSTSSDVVALKIGSNITIKRNGGGTPSFSVGNTGFTYQQDYNGNSVTNSNPFNNGAGMGIKNTTPGSPVILGLLRNGVFGAVNTAGSTLNICNPYGFANSTGTNLYTATQNVNFRNTSNLEISYGPASGSNDVDIIRYQSANTDSVTDYRHGLQLSSIPNAGASTSNGRGYATNGSNVIDMDTVGYDVRSFVKVGQSIYIHEGWTTSIQNSSNPIRFTITGVDYINETITLDSNWTGATGNVSCWIEDTLVVIRNYDGSERFRFYGDGTLKLQSNITASGHVSASTYYGDGSNLTGIPNDPFPYTGSAIISGSLDVIGDITGSSKIDLNDGSNNVLISTGNSTITTSNTVAVGYQALTALTTGTENTVVGYQAGNTLTTERYNTIIGYQALNNHTGGESNTVLGARAGNNGTIGNSNTLIGMSAGRSANGSLGGSVFVGHEAGASYGDGYLSQEIVGIGKRALFDSDGRWNTAVGSYAGENASGGNNGGLAAFGSHAGQYAKSDSNTLIGGFAGRGVLGSSTFTNTVAVGYQALTALTTGAGNTAVGYQSQQYTTTGIQNTSVGFRALQDLVDGNWNTALGYDALRDVTTGTNNIGIGASAGKLITTGQTNLVIGRESGGALTTQQGNTFLGYTAGQYIVGNNNIAIGRNAMAGSSGNSTVDNTVAIGYQAGTTLTTGTSNILIGYQAGSTLTSESNKLYIENSNSTTPLIYGEFDNDLVRINGKLFVSNSLEVTGSATITEDITTNTLSNISTTLASDSATNVDTFATATYTGAIYDYILVDATVGARAGQFMVAQDNGNITFTDTSTKHLTDSPIPEITAQINGANVEVQVTNGNGYTFKSFTKKL